MTFEFGVLSLLTVLLVGMLRLAWEVGKLAQAMLKALDAFQVLSEVVREQEKRLEELERQSRPEARR